jgi:hypothetical protein
MFHGDAHGSGTLSSFALTAVGTINVSPAKIGIDGTLHHRTESLIHHFPDVFPVDRRKQRLPYFHIVEWRLAHIENDEVILGHATLADLQLRVLRDIGKLRDGKK